MEETLLTKAGRQYGKGLLEIVAITKGLIHKTYKVTFAESSPVLLQSINTKIFTRPKEIIENYRLLQEHIAKTDSIIPSILTGINGNYYYIDEDGNFWRAFDFIENSYSIHLVSDTSQAFSVAKCFGEFTKALNGLEATKLHTVIPDFHNLSLRYKQFEKAISGASPERLLSTEKLIEELSLRKNLVRFYEELDDNQYPLRILHHDCKISNVLFDRSTMEIVCPVDLDTVMPGKFFSDLGDMIRTMACSVNEGSKDWESIFILKDYYDSILEGYLAGIGDSLTPKEKEHIHYAGLVMTYMQSLRFLTDYLKNDQYYQTNYPEQNFDRAKNQFLLLNSLEEFLKETYSVLAH